VKKKAKGKNLVLDYKGVELSNTTAMQFEFEGQLAFITIDIPGVGVFVVGRDCLNPSRCWSYPPGTPFKKAIGEMIQAVLEEAARQSKILKKKA
jgi:hypothetical protein